MILRSIKISSLLTTILTHYQTFFEILIHLKKEFFHFLIESQNGICETANSLARLNYTRESGVRLFHNGCFFIEFAAAVETKSLDLIIFFLIIETRSKKIKF